jgi:hypothetical protein
MTIVFKTRTGLMFRKITSLVVAVSFILLMQVADCMAMSTDQQTMKCCRTMPCSPTNRTHDCCKKMVVATQTPSVLPVAHVPLSSPLAIAVEPVPLAQITRLTEMIWPVIVPPQHSPPDLYTLYGSFLI